MRKSWLAANIVALTIAGSAAWAEAPKKGRVLCEGATCASHDVPTGSILERAVDGARDLADRMKWRTGIAADQLAGRPVKDPLAPKDRLRVSGSAPRRSQSLSANAQAIATNLPGYYQGIDRSEIEASEKVIYVPKSADPRLKGLRPGDVVWAVIEQEIVASPNVPTPVRALAVAGPFKGGFFFGEATLDKELKRVLFTFTKLRLKDRASVFSVKASGLSPRGSIGLEGEYVSQTGKFFIAELASAAAAGFVDSTVNRNQTTLGTYVQEPSLANSSKTAAATALSKTTEHMAEGARNAPEYTRIYGYQEIQVIIQDDPVDSGT